MLLVRERRSPSPAAVSTHTWSPVQVMFEPMQSFCRSSRVLKVTVGCGQDGRRGHPNDLVHVTGKFSVQGVTPAADQQWGYKFFQPHRGAGLLHLLPSALYAVALRTGPVLGDGCRQTSGVAASVANVPGLQPLCQCV